LNLPCGDSPSKRVCLTGESKVKNINPEVKKFVGYETQCIIIEDPSGGSNDYYICSESADEIDKISSAISI